MRARAQVVPKERPPRARLGRARRGEPNVVEVYIGYLRRKIGTPADRDRARRRLPARHMRRQRPARLGLRGRLMAVGLLGVGAALLVGGALLYAVLRLALQRTVANEALASADEVAVLAARERCPTRPGAGGEVVQLVDPDEPGRGASSTPTASCRWSRPTNTPGARRRHADDPRKPGRDGRPAHRGRGAVPGTGRSSTLVVAAVPTADVDASRQ